MDSRIDRLASWYLLATAEERYLEQVLDMTEAEFIAQPPPGFSYQAHASWTARRPSKGHTVLTPQFFAWDRGMRAYLLYHEIGHDLMRDFNRHWKDVLEPFRDDRDVATHPEPHAYSPYDNPFGASTRPEELVADAYAELFTGGERHYQSEKYVALFRRVRQLARKFGVPLP